MGKRERENPCLVCGHYHKYEEGEVCGICGHRMPVISDNTSCFIQDGAFPSEIIPDFIYLGSFDHASRSHLLMSQGISMILNTVPSCQNLYKNSFGYYSLQDDKSLFFDDAIKFLEKCKTEKARVLVHCMTGKSRSPAVVIAYLMKSEGWRLEQSYQWVKERRPSVELTQAVYEQLLGYEKTIFGSSETTPPTDSISFGFAKNESIVTPSFNTSTDSSIFDRPLGSHPKQFVFGEVQGVNQVNSTATHSPMGSS